LIYKLFFVLAASRQLTKDPDIDGQLKNNEDRKLFTDMDLRRHKGSLFFKKYLENIIYFLQQKILFVFKFKIVQKNCPQNTTPAYFLIFSFIKIIELSMEIIEIKATLHSPSKTTIRPKSFTMLGSNIISCFKNS
jgi:hypothetical protein